MLALVQTARLVDPYRPAQPCAFDFLLQRRMQIALSIGGAGNTRCPFRPRIMANKNMSFECWQKNLLLKSNLSSD